MEINPDEVDTFISYMQGGGEGYTEVHHAILSGLVRRLRRCLLVWRRGDWRLPIVHLGDRGVKAGEVREDPVKESCLAAGPFTGSGWEDDQEGGAHDIKEDEGEDNTQDSGEIYPRHGPGHRELAGGKMA